jgi:hypothetical protein
VVAVGRGDGVAELHAANKMTKTTEMMINQTALDEVLVVFFILLTSC